MWLHKMNCSVLNFAVLSSVLACAQGVGVGEKQLLSDCRAWGGELGLGQAHQREVGESRSQVLTQPLFGDVNSIHERFWIPGAAVWLSLHPSFLCPRERRASSAVCLSLSLPVSWQLSSFIILASFIAKFLRKVEKRH